MAGVEGGGVSCAREAAKRGEPGTQALVGVGVDVAPDAAAEGSRGAEPGDEVGEETALGERSAGFVLCVGGGGLFVRVDGAVVVPGFFQGVEAIVVGELGPRHVGTAAGA